MDWPAFDGNDDPDALTKWAIPAFTALADAVERGAVATLWIPSDLNRGHHRLVWQIAGTGQLRSRQDSSLLWPGTLVVLAGDAEEQTKLDPQDGAQQIELRAINDDISLTLYRCDDAADSVWRDQFRFPAGIGRRWQQLLDTALSCGCGEQDSDIGLPLLVATCRLAAKAVTIPPRPHRGRRLRQKQIEKLVLNHFFEPDCSAETIAAALELSSSHVQRVFKRHSGESLNSFITRQRIRKADQLIAAEDITNLAQRCGFTNDEELQRGRKSLSS